MPVYRSTYVRDTRAKSKHIHCALTIATSRVVHAKSSSCWWNEQPKRARVVFLEFKPGTYAARPAVALAVVPAAREETGAAASLDVRPAAAQASGLWAEFVLLR